MDRLRDGSRLEQCLVEFACPGKWILAGEHAVLRGSPALVFPAPTFVMKFRYEPLPQPLSVSYLGPFGPELKVVFWGVLESACNKLGRARHELRGALVVESGIPIGSGLGASAALCAGVTRLLVSWGWVDSQDDCEFARSLEDLFHGESSGVDVTVSLRGEPLIFVRGQKAKPLMLTWSPHLYLSYSGTMGVTSECVEKVKALFRQDNHRAQWLDGEMAAATEQCQVALSLPESHGAFDLLKAAIQRAHACFVGWGLVEGPMQQHLDHLLSLGACAVKPTGSGGGGFVLSLWNEPQSGSDFIPGFASRVS